MAALYRNRLSGISGTLSSQRRREMVAHVRRGWLSICLASLLSLSLLMFSPLRSGAQGPDLGIDADMHQKVIFPTGALSVINTDISAYPVDPNSANLMAS